MSLTMLQMNDLDVHIAERIATLLDGRTVATAESCTAGRIAERLACVAGADEFLRGGVVAYQETMKRRLLGVVAESMFSLECAEQMALGVCDLMRADIGVATTGVAGDDPQDGVMPGTVFIGVAIDGVASACSYVFTGRPTEVCDLAARHGLVDLLDGVLARS